MCHVTAKCSTQPNRVFQFLINIIPRDPDLRDVSISGLHEFHRSFELCFMHEYPHLGYCSAQFVFTRNTFPFGNSSSSQEIREKSLLQRSGITKLKNHCNVNFVSYEVVNPYAMYYYYSIFKDIDVSFFVPKFIYGDYDADQGKGVVVFEDFHSSSFELRDSQLMLLDPKDVSEVGYSISIV